jgi:hypothetical protein
LLFLLLFALTTTIESRHGLGDPALAEELQTTSARTTQYIAKSGIGTACLLNGQPVVIAPKPGKK